MANHSNPNLIPVTAADHAGAKVFVGVTVPLLACCTFAIAARLTPRLRPAWRFGWDDGLILVAYFLVVTEWALLMTPTAWAVSNPPQYIDMVQRKSSTKLGFIAIPIWAGAVAAIKLSAIVMLQRFLRGAWTVFLYFMAAVQVAFVIGNVVFLLAIQCRPIAANWNTELVLDGNKHRCLGPHAVQLASNISSYTNVATDLILSVIPIAFLKNLQRPLQERILICFLMALGLSASAASVRKILYIRSWGHTDDQIALDFALQMWTCLEILLGMLAACLPCLKAALQQGLHKLRTMARKSLPYRSLTRVQEITKTDRNPGGVGVNNAVVKEKKELKKDDKRLVTDDSNATTLTCAESFDYPGRLGSENDPAIGKTPPEVHCPV